MIKIFFTKNIVYYNMKKTLLNTLYNLGFVCLVCLVAFALIVLGGLGICVLGFIWVVIRG